MFIIRLSTDAIPSPYPARACHRAGGPAAEEVDGARGHAVPGETLAAVLSDAVHRGGDRLRHQTGGDRNDVPTTRVQGAPGSTDRLAGCRTPARRANGGDRHRPTDLEPARPR